MVVLYRLLAAVEGSLEVGTCAIMVGGHGDYRQEVLLLIESTEILDFFEAFEEYVDAFVTVFITT